MARTKYWPLSQKQQDSLLILLAAGAVVIFHFWSLTRFPPPNEDEAWAACRAWALIKTGKAFGSLDAGVFDRFPGYWTFLPWIPTWIQSLSLRFFSVPNVFAVRLISFLAGLALLGAVYIIGKRLAGKTVGGLSVLLTALSSPFIYSAHVARYDILAAALGFWAVALHFSHQYKRVTLSLLSGLFVGLAFEMHPHAMIFGPALLLLFIVECRLQFFRKRCFWGFLGGVGSGLFIYAALHIFRYPQTYFAANRLAFSLTHVPPFLAGDLSVLVSAWRGTHQMLHFCYGFFFYVILWAVFILARRNSPADRKILAIAAGLVLSFVLLVRNKMFYYAILLTPALDILAAVFLSGLTRNVPGKQRWRLIQQAVGWILYGASLSVFSISSQPDYLAIHDAVQARLLEVIPAGSSIMGSQTYWFRLYQHRYYSWESLVYYQRYDKESTLEQAMEAVHPDIFIFDAHLSGFVSDRPGESMYGKFLRLSRTELTQFLEKHATLISSFDAPLYGPVYIWKINWDRKA